jgi:hypothetical protein
MIPFKTAMIIIAQTAPAVELPTSMTAAGWAIMIGSISFVLSLTVFCFYRVLTLPPIEVEEHLKAPLDIDTRDTQNPD